MLRQAWARGESGATAVMFALSAAVMLGVGAIAVDVGQVYAARANLQDAADKAAAAAAVYIDGSDTCTTQAVSEARHLLAANWPTIAGNTAMGSADAIPLDGTTAGGAIECTGWKVRVTAPTVRVDFGLAEAISDISNANVPATAEATVFSPKHSQLMPSFAVGAQLLGLPALCTYGPSIMFESPNFNLYDDILGARADCRIGMGNFGSVRMPRAANVDQNDELALNIAVGPDFTMTRHPDGGTPWSCSAATAVVSVEGALQDGTNCLDTLKGYRHNAAEDGLIDGVDGHPGLLNRPTSPQCKAGLLSGIVPGLAGRNDLYIRDKWINNDRLECYLKLNISLSAIASPDYAGPIVLDPAVMDSPRFVWMPVFGQDVPGIWEIPGNLLWGNNSKGYYKIVDFRPGFIMGPLDALNQVFCLPLPLIGASCNGLSLRNSGPLGIGGEAKLDSVQVFLFSERALPRTADVAETKTYLGAGPRVIRLTD